MYIYIRFCLSSPVRETSCHGSRFEESETRHFDLPIYRCQRAAGSTLFVQTNEKNTMAERSTCLLFFWLHRSAESVWLSPFVVVYEPRAERLFFSFVHTSARLLSTRTNVSRLRCVYVGNIHCSRMFLAVDCRCSYMSLASEPSYRCLFVSSLR